MSWTHFDILATLENMMKVTKTSLHSSQDIKAIWVPPVDDWVKRTCYIYTMEYYSSIKKRNLVIDDNMDGPVWYHTK